MKSKLYKTFFIIIFGIWLQGCVANDPLVISSTPTRAIPTLLNSLSPTVTATITLSPTPVHQTDLPTQTNVLLAHLEFPEWIKTRETNILLTPMGTFNNGFDHLSFIAAGTWDQFDLPPLEISGFFWLPDGTGFGLLSKDVKSLTIVNIDSGDVATYPAPQKIYIDGNEWADTPVELVGFGDYAHPSDFILAQQGRISSDGKYFLSAYYYTDNHLTSIINTETGDKVDLPPSNDITLDFEGAWSPVSPLVAITYLKNCEETIRSPQCEEYKLQVYDASSGKLVSSYDNIANFSWSPDGMQILHTRYPNLWDSDGGTALRNPPCIFNIISGKTTCFDEVLPHHSAYTTIMKYAWSPDMKKISYVYSEPIDSIFPFAGGFCLITIETGKIDCPVTVFEGIKDSAVSPIAHEYRWSPDGNFVVFYLEARAYGGDDGTTPRLAMLDISTNTQKIIGDKVGFYRNLGLWRPLP